LITLVKEALTMGFKTYEHSKNITKISGVYYKGITMYITLDYDDPSLYKEEEHGGHLDFAITVRDSTNGVPLAQIKGYAHCGPDTTEPDIQFIHPLEGYVCETIEDCLFRRGETYKDYKLLVEEAVDKVVGDEEVDKVLWGFMFNVFERDMVDALVPEGWYTKIK
jgi:hypothetical protein